MSPSNSQVPVNRHNQKNTPSRVTPQQKYAQQQQQQRYNNHVNENSSSTMNLTQGPPSTPPRTPRRPQGKAPDRNATVESAAESGPENTIPPRSANRRPKAKNSSITPAAQRTEHYRGTPPVRMQSDSSSKLPTATAIAAYAGPTFHASPAPSALPIPSFYSKSADSPSMAKATLDQDSSSAGDSPPSTAALPSSETNLLDTLFSSNVGADERARSAQSDVGPFRPPSQTPPNSNVTPQQRPGLYSGHSHHGSASSLFKMEMDGGYQGQPIRAEGITPYHERIKAARSTPTSLSSSPNTTGIAPLNGMDQSEAFKSLLFSKNMPTQPQPNQPLPPFQNAPAAPFQNAPPAPFPYQNGPQHGPQNGPYSPYNNGYQNNHHNNYQNGGYQNGYQNGLHMSSPATPLRSTLYHSPQQQRFPHQGPGNAYRNSPRNSGLRQEVTSFRSPNSVPRPTAGLTNGMFAPPQVSLNYKENTASPARTQNTTMAQNQNQNQITPQAQRAVSQPMNNYTPYNKDPGMKSMEDTLKNMLISPPSANGAGVLSPVAPVVPQ